VIEKLKLPIAYFSTRTINEGKFLVFKLLELGGSSGMGYIVEWRDNVRNSLLPHDKGMVERRKALEATLRIP